MSANITIREILKIETIEKKLVILLTKKNTTLSELCVIAVIILLLFTSEALNVLKQRLLQNQNHSVHVHVKKEF